MKKILVIILSIPLLILVLFFADWIIYKTNYKKSYYCVHTGLCPMRYVTDNKFIIKGMNLNNYGRYKTDIKNPENPIIVFGSSFAQGWDSIEKGFPAALAKHTNRNVIDRTYNWGGIQYLYFQSCNDYFYQIVPKTKDIIYVMSYNDVEEAFISTTNEISDTDFKLHYYWKNGNLNMSNYRNRFLNFIRSIYLVKLINRIYVEKYINNYLNYIDVADLLVMYFDISKDNFLRHYNNEINFNIIMYGYIPAKEELIRELYSKGYNVIDFSDVDLNDNNYNWEELLPLLKLSN